MDREVMAEMILGGFDAAVRDARESLLANARFATDAGPEPNGKALTGRVINALAALAIAAGGNSNRTAKTLLAAAWKSLDDKEN